MIIQQQPGHANKSVDLKIEMGDDHNLQLLTNFKGKIGFGADRVIEVQQDCQFKEDIKDDLIVILKLQVQSGREKQAVQYIQAAQKQEQGASPLQNLLKQKPNASGTLQVIQGKGYITLKYRFYKDHLGQLSELQELYEKYKDSLPLIKIQLLLKGFVSHNKKNRTNVKVDYCNLSADTQNFSLSSFNQLLSQIIGDNEISSNPTIDMLMRLKFARLRLKIASFRKLSAFYMKVKNSQFQHPDKSFPYINRGIFKQSASLYVMFGKKMAVKFHSDYESEDVFIRLIKVYSVFLKNTFDLPIL